MKILLFIILLFLANVSAIFFSRYANFGGGEAFAFIFAMLGLNMGLIIYMVEKANK